MSAFTTAVIIFNPSSTGDARKNAEELQAALHKSRPKLPVRLLPTAHAGHAVQLAYETAKAADPGTSPLIISASGDGGYNEVINGALRAQNEGAAPICAVLPSGNANDHARTMQDRPLAESITESYTRNAISRLDILQVQLQAASGKTSTRYAHSYAGLGLTPSVAVELNKYTLNSLRESLIIFKTFWNLRPVVIRVNGKTLYLDSLIWSIIPEMAKVLTLSGSAEADDGMFEIISLPHNKKWQLAFRLIQGVVKDLGAKSRMHDYTCTVLQPIPVQLDGEIIKVAANTELKIVICPKLLRTIV